MQLNWIINLVVLLQLTMVVVNADLKCHYCGMRDTCTFPHVESLSSKINCKDSCMKFDGKGPNGNRIVVRSCGQNNATNCASDQNWNKALGQLCFCNSNNCNTSSKITKLDSIIAFVSISISSFY